MLQEHFSPRSPSRFGARAAFAVAVVLILLGCAQEAPHKNQPVAAAPVEVTPPRVEPVAVAPTPPPVPSAKAEDRIAPDGTVAEFVTDATELDEHAFITIGNLSESAAKAKLVEIIGYCDKRDAGKNTRNVALARAAAVRDELVKLGVSAKRIRMKFVTTETRNAVVVNLK